MSTCRVCRGAGFVGPNPAEGDPCLGCGGLGMLCDDPRGPDEGPCPRRPRWAMGTFTYCGWHAPSHQPLVDGYRRVG